MQEQKEFVERDFVYIGKSIADDGKVYCGNAIVNEDCTLEKTKWYGYKKKMDRIVGGVYRGASFSENTAKGLEQAIWRTRWHDQGDVIKWQADDEKVEVEIRSKKMEKDEGRISELEKILLPLRTQYESYRSRHDCAGMEALEKSMLRALKSAPRVIEKD
jgi:hypothetical protein